MVTKRISKHQYYLNIAEEASKRSTCISLKVGCIIVKDDQIISTGYNGAPRQAKDCLELGYCLRRKLGIPSGTQYETCRSVHGEQNAIINAARVGVGVLGADMFLFTRKGLEGDQGLSRAYPCFICKKIIINAGISKLIGNDENGGMIVYDVNEWQEEWAKNDMVTDTTKYDANYKTNAK
jgi:dCMP deaminase